MSKTNLAIVGLILISVSLSCRSFMPKNESAKNAEPGVDFTNAGKGLDVRVQVDKKRTSSGKVTKAGGSVSLAAEDGSKFTLDVPANAVDAETTITLTAVKSIDGAPLDNNAPTAVQLEPSGLIFKEMATLTIVPGKEIPLKEQIIFGYEGDGADYHLAMIDPTSSDIKIKLGGFSGAGVGSGADAAWAANLMIQAREAETRLSQILGQYLQEQRRKTFLEGEDSVDKDEFYGKIKSALDQFEDQVLLKQMVAAELDCHNAPQAVQSLLGLQRNRGLLGFPRTREFEEKYEKLAKIAEGCSWPYQIAGGLDDWQTNSKVCDIMKPFTLTGGGITMELSGGISGTYSYSGPYNSNGSGTYTITLPEGGGKPGTMTGSGDGSAGGATNSGTEKYTLTPIAPCN